MVVSLGPTSMASYRNLPKNPRSDGTGMNKRCLRRDINVNAALGATADRAYKLLTESKNMDVFYNTLLGQPPPRNDPYPWGVSDDKFLNYLHDQTDLITLPSITSLHISPPFLPTPFKMNKD